MLKYALACAALLLSGPVRAQWIEPGDTLVLTFEDRGSVPYYVHAEDGDIDFVGRLAVSDYKGDTMIVREHLERIYYLATLGSDTLVVGGLSLSRVGINLTEVRERERLAAAQRRQREEQRAWIESLRRDGIPIRISSVDFSVNSAGGVEPDIRLRNISGRTLKYITFQIIGFNPVGDPVRGRHSRNTTHTLRLIGPIEPGGYGNYDYEDDPAWYARTTSCLEIRRVVVEFMNGGTYIMINDLRKARQYSTDYKLDGECSNI